MFIQIGCSPGGNVSTPGRREIHFWLPRRFRTVAVNSFLAHVPVALTSARSPFLRE